MKWWSNIIVPTQLWLVSWSLPSLSLNPSNAYKINRLECSLQWFGTILYCSHYIQYSTVQYIDTLKLYLKLFSFSYLLIYIYIFTSLSQKGSDYSLYPKIPTICYSNRTSWVFGCWLEFSFGYFNVAQNFASSIYMDYMISYI